MRVIGYLIMGGMLVGVGYEAGPITAILMGLCLVCIDILQGS